MKIIGVIPARYESSRFQGKPLADICGKPMIWWVYQHASQVKYFDELYVATDDQRIYDACEKFDMKCIMTSTSHRTGTDRIGEVAEKIPADLYVNIQGDEPLMEPLAKGGPEAAAAVIRKMTNELKAMMVRTGSPDVKHIDPAVIHPVSR